MWTICVTVRSVSLTASPLGNRRATSGSSTTTLLPSANRWAYLPRTPAEKSASRRVSEFPFSYSLRSRRCAVRALIMRIVSCSSVCTITSKRSRFDRSSSSECSGSGVVIESASATVLEGDAPVRGRHNPCLCGSRVRCVASTRDNFYAGAPAAPSAGPDQSPSVRIKARAFEVRTTPGRSR